MHRVGRDKFLTIDILKKYRVKEKDAVIFSFGEIDIRCHVLKQVKLFHRDLNEVLDTLLNNFFVVIRELREQDPTLIFLTYTATPPTNAQYNPDQPYYGSLEERILISYLFNDRLKELSSLHQIDVIDVYDYYADIKGVLQIHYSDGGVHIAPQHNRFIFLQLQQAPSLAAFW